MQLNKLNQQLQEFHNAIIRANKWDRRYLNMAETVATWSKDPSTKVGAVLVGSSNRVLSMGYNGFPPGADDSPEKYADREYKYKHVVHAEINALKLSPGGELAQGGTLYVTFPPCPACAQAIVEAKVKRVLSLPVPKRESDPEWENRWKAMVDESARKFKEGSVYFRVLDEE